MMEKLPTEIALEIFYRLPPESVVVVCKFVCKSWRNLLPHDDGNYFANMNLCRRRHHQKSSNLDCSTLNFIALLRGEEEGINEFHIREYDQVKNHQLNCKVVKRIVDYFPQFGRYSETELISSCNGLLCLTRGGYHGDGRTDWGDKIGIYNPLLNEYVHLPISDIQYDHMPVIGFGHNPITDEYKVVRVSYRSDIGEVEVYTLGSNKSSNGGAGMWRSKGTITYRLRSWSPSPSVLINESIHWLTCTEVCRKDIIVVSFDLEDEEFRVIPAGVYV